MTHPLAGAYARVARAKVHRAELEAIEHSHWESHEHEVVIDPHLVGDVPNCRVVGSNVIPIAFSIALGEAVYNLRAALDYLVYELAILDSGSPKEGTQFPIFLTEDDRAKKLLPKYLSGLSDAHVRAILALQPYHSCNWTKHIATLSNPDKHRYLCGVSPQKAGAVFFIRPNKRAAGEFVMPRFDHTPHIPYRIRGRLDLQPILGEEGSAHYEFGLYIALGESGPAVVNLLGIIESEVRATLDGFRGDFPA